MLAPADRIFKNLHDKESWHLSDALRRGDWDGVKNLIAKGPEAIIKAVTDSGLRGRGGAGFPTGRKWSLMPPPDSRPRYLVINGDEGEPGTCKDRDILLYEPHKVVEGALLSSVALDAHVCYIYIRGEYKAPADILQQAIDEAYAAGLIGPNACGSGYAFDMYIHRGAGAYICGEESALLESLEGKKGYPRLKPPFPAHFGLFGCPTIINNVETIAVVGEILRRGAGAYARFGREGNKGTKLFCFSGHVNTPVVVEEAMSIGFVEAVETHAGGFLGGWRRFKAVIPGGSSVPVIPKALAEDLILDYDGCREKGSALGSGAVIVMDESTDMVAAIARLSRFYHHESCGQCTPCREGTGWLAQILTRWENAQGEQGEIEMVESILKSIEGRTICALADAAVWPVGGLLKHFRHEVEARLSSIQPLKKSGT